MRHSKAPRGPGTARMPFQEGGCRPRRIADGKQGSGNQPLGIGIEHHLFRRSARRRPRVAVAAGHDLELFPGLRVAVKDRYPVRSEEHTSELQSLMRISYAVFCL